MNLTITDSIKIAQFRDKLITVIKKLVVFLFFLLLSFTQSWGGSPFPRMGAFIELDPITPFDPWEERSCRIQWVLSRLNCEGLRVALLDPDKTPEECEVFYVDGPPFKKILSQVKNKPKGILQSESRKVINITSIHRSIQASPQISLIYSEGNGFRVVTVSPDLSNCFNDYQAVQALSEAILWLAEVPKNMPRIAPFPYGKNSAVILIVHGEGKTKTISKFMQNFLNGPASLTYAISEDTFKHYPQIISEFSKHPNHEIAVHNHIFREFKNQDEILKANIELHRTKLSGYRPVGLVGPYLNYYDDLRESLIKNNFKWFLDKDLPYPLNIPISFNEEPVIDITESLKPYDGWWKLDEAESLWKTGLNFKRLKREIAVCSWHDIHMGKDPNPFLNFIYYFKSLPDVWHTTAKNFQSFWRDRWKAKLEVLTLNNNIITLRIKQAPEGLTLFDNKNIKEVIIPKSNPYEIVHLFWNPTFSFDLSHLQSTFNARLRWGMIGSIARRDSLDTEFALVNIGEEKLQKEKIVLPLPEELRSRIAYILPTTIKLYIYGIKGLKFKEIYEVSIKKGDPIPKDLSFSIDAFPNHSIRFFRLRFIIESKKISSAIFFKKVKKYFWLLIVMILVFLLAAVTIKKIKNKNALL